MTKITSLWIPPAFPDPTADNYPKLLNEALAAYFRQQAGYLEQVLNTNVSPLRVGKTTIDLGSAETSFASGAASMTAFNGLLLKNTTTTTSNAFQTALNYTGSGVLMMVVGLSQVAGGASTATGMSVQITIDGNVVYTGTLTTAASRMAAAVGRLAVTDTTNTFITLQSHPIGLTFLKTCKVEFKSGTNGQGVSLGWDVLKLT